MILQALYAFVSYVISPGYYWHIAISIAALIITYAFAQGRTTNRERDLHARTILVTGAFSPVGITLLSDLATRGANIIALSDYPLGHPQTALLIPALRAATKNEHIFAEHADLTSPASIRGFCTKFLTGEDQRLDGIIFAHEYSIIGSLFGSKAQHEKRREAASLATFLITTLLLPSVLVAPVERDIRIIHLVNPFYAAATPTFTSELVSSLSSTSSPSTRPVTRSVMVAEGYRALRTIVLTRHLQRILNALPNRAPTLDPKFPGGVDPSKDGVDAQQPSASASPSQAPTETPNYPSNIVAVSVCPGISRSDTVHGLLGMGEEDRSVVTVLVYVLLYPLIWLFAKSANMSTQSVLHALFLPTPFKRMLSQMAAATDADSRAASGAITEVLKPGALYRECSVVMLPVPPLPDAPHQRSEDNVSQEKPPKKQSEKRKKGDGKSKKEDDFPELEIEDDNEYGGEQVGRVVWEWYETHLKAWEATEKEQ